MSKFAGLKGTVAATVEKPSAAPVAVERKKTASQGKAPSREGKKAVVGYFSEDLSKALNILATEQGKSLQALLGEGIDLLMRKYGKHPFGEK